MRRYQMPLSEYEQRVLEQMERQLSSDDPKLVHAPWSACTSLGSSDESCRSICSSTRCSYSDRGIWYLRIAGVKVDLQDSSPLARTVVASPRGRSGLPAARRCARTCS